MSLKGSIKILIIWFCIFNIQDIHAQFLHSSDAPKGTFQKKIKETIHPKIEIEKRGTPPSAPISTQSLTLGLEPIPLEKSLLWEISGNGLQHTSYLFGTIHQVCIEDYFFHPYMLAAFDKTEELVLELDMTAFEELYGKDGVDYEASLAENDDVELWNTVAVIDDSFVSINTSNRNNDEAIEETIAVESNTDVEAQIMDSNRGRANQLRSHSISTSDRSQWVPPPPISRSGNNSEVLNTSKQPKKYGEDCEAIISYESKLIQIAKAKKLKVSGLETVDEQMELLYYMNEHLGENELNQNSSLNSDSDETDLKYEERTLGVSDLVKAYKQQDINLILNLMQYSGLGLVNMNAMLFKRNENWMQLLPPLLADAPIFIAVGAGHLPGKLGLINLLRKQGYTVTPVLK